MGTVIIECVVMLIVAIIGCYLIPFLKERNLYNAVVIAVQAAEQIFNENGKGAEKFNYVAEWVSNKFKISKADLKNLIESAVYEMKEKNKSGGDK